MHFMSPLDDLVVANECKEIGSVLDADKLSGLALAA